MDFPSGGSAESRDLVRCRAIFTTVKVPERVPTRSLGGTREVNSVLMLSYPYPTFFSNSSSESKTPTHD